MTNSVRIAIFASLLAMTLLVSPALADTTYTYTGNPFSFLASGYSCPPVCNVTGSFTVATPLAANVAEGTVVTPLSATLNAGGVTLTLNDLADPSNAAYFNLRIGTDGAGNISTWTFFMLGPANTARILAQDRTLAVFDSLRYVDGTGNVGSIVGLVTNDPGTWTVSNSEPEPGSILLFGSSLVVLFARRRQ